MSPILETIMLICFGISWPLNLVKAYKARTAKGTSLASILLIITGYLAGIAAKLTGGDLNSVLAAYLFNVVVVSLNLTVYCRNVALDKKRAK